MHRIVCMYALDENGVEVNKKKNDYFLYKESKVKKKKKSGRGG